MATENKSITVIQLYEACLAEIRKGNANRHILLSGDDEGNWYHEMFFLFTPTKGEDIEYALPVSVEDFDKNYLILG